MSEPLIIWLPEALDTPWAYYQSEDVQGWANDDEERQALSKIGNGSCIVVCPGTWFRTFAHSLPEMKASERISAAGFAIEEKLAAPLDEQHIVLGIGDDQRVGVISKDKMELALAALDHVKLAPSRMLAENEAFSREMDAFETSGRLVQPGPMGYSMDSVNDGHTPHALFPLMEFDDALNYAQGNFTRRQSTLPNMRSFGGLAAALAIAGFSWLVWQGAQARAMQQQADQLNAEAAQLYTDATGKTSPNPAAAISREVRKGGQTSADFMTLSNRFFNGLKQVDGVFVESLRYNETRGQLTLKLVYPSFETAARLEQVFKTQSSEFTSGAVREQNGELIGEGVFKLGGRS